MPLLVGILTGCQNTTTSTSEPNQEPKQTTDNKSEPTVGKVDEGTKVEPEMSAMSAALKTDAFRYYGFAKSKSPGFQLSGAPAGIKTGAYEMKLVELSDTRAVFRQTWTGEMASLLPAGDYEVTPKGVFALNVGDKKLDPPQMELPADPKPGVSWTSPNKLDLPEASITNSVMKIVGTEKVKVKIGTFDALVVKATVQGSMGTAKFERSMVVYYVKDQGPVKIVISGKGPDGKPVVSTLEAISK